MTDYLSVYNAVKAISNDVSLVAVSKFHPYEAVMEAYDAGARIFGENRVQEMREKFPPKNERPEGMKVYLIGQLQRNKVRKAIEWADRIESVDSLPLIEKIEKECEALAVDMDILLEFNSFPIEIDSHYKRFAAVPIEHDLIIFVGLDIGLDGLLEHFQTHAGFSPSIDLRLVEIIAIMAVEIAERACRLDHYVELHRSGQPDGVAECHRILEIVCHVGSCYRSVNLGY